MCSIFYVINVKIGFINLLEPMFSICISIGVNSDNNFFVRNRLALAEDNAIQLRNVSLIGFTAC